MASIKICTGIKTYDIEDEKGNIRGQISFNPSDMNFFTRAQQTQSAIENAISQLSKINEANTEDDFIKIIDETDKEIKEKLNVLFDDPNTSEIIFGNQNCLNTLNGVTFVERFLLAFFPIIKSDFASEKKKSAKRIEKYTNQVK